MISEFKDEYRWLSNFTLFEEPLKYDRLSYPTVEHFYVAMKTFDKIKREQISLLKSPGDVKKEGRQIVLRSDWDNIKDKVMWYSLQWKFGNNNPILRAKLLSTDPQNIQEGNWWGDKYWGISLKDGQGENLLGRMLMEIREDVKGV